MSKKLNRKKQLRNGLRRAGAFSSTVTKVVDETKKVVKRAEQSASAAGKAVSKKVEQAVEATKEQAQKVANSVEDFAANLGGLPLDRAKTFYDEGIKSVSDFKNWTEKELLDLKGIGPATIKKLKENGIKFK
ncbi:Helicase [Streptococcus pneumoniae]|uniref:helix-hairpin-helix domain-containing protein n=1 Tax=Streptococcus pneumoniae TaxID=1313 RepID=UPI000768D6EA|nr:helix-hairpin-helix domain-containing protein [Streptococcus pneumoniae]MDS2792704.1 helix-hairpin-helix domain-containing protein [Streptococcus pneumoniae]MDS2968069.1 helix-hairpin-helix domain-containing protein [Streptococcus pneumoniae]MDS3752198.1 helix-hairpin-helix domain-containing protein [Streptococcus pneumoniae]CZE27063.1 Helicase [Streptococcus pneumoniae]VIU52121.1 Helicase [Streptococcus pneumoniae]